MGVTRKPEIAVQLWFGLSAFLDDLKVKGTWSSLAFSLPPLYCLNYHTCTSSPKQEGGLLAVCPLSEYTDFLEQSVSNRTDLCSHHSTAF